MAPSAAPCSSWPSRWSWRWRWSRSSPSSTSSGSSRLGSDSVATVGLTKSVLSLIYAVAIGLSISATALVARRTGEKDPERASATAIQAIALGLLIAAPIGLLGAFFAPRILSLMGASAAVVAKGSGFTAVMLGGNVVIMLLFLNNAIRLLGMGPQGVFLAIAIAFSTLAVATLLVFRRGTWKTTRV